MPAGAALCPVSEYGRQKAATEIRLQAMLAAGSAVGILRLAKIVSPGMPLLRQWQAALAAGQSIRPFHDMVMAPTPAGVAAAAIAALLADRATGIWQLTGSQDVSYAEIGGHIAQQIGADPALVRPVAAASAGMPEGSTPRHTTLDSGALQRFRDRCTRAVADDRGGSRRPRQRARSDDHVEQVPLGDFVPRFSVRAMARRGCWFCTETAGSIATSGPRGAGGSICNRVAAEACRRCDRSLRGGFGMTSLGEKLLWCRPNAC